MRWLHPDHIADQWNGSGARREPRADGRPVADDAVADVHREQQQGGLVETDVYEKDIDNIADGQSAVIHASSLPKFETTGKVDLVLLPVIDPKSHAIKVQISIPNPAAAQRRYVRRGDDWDRVTATCPCAPLSAVQHTEKGDCVSRKSKEASICVDGCASGLEQGDYCVLESGVKPERKL